MKISLGKNDTFDVFAQNIDRRHTLETPHRVENIVLVFFLNPFLVNL